MKNWKDAFQDSPSQEYENQLFSKANKELAALSNNKKSRKWFLVWFGSCTAGALGLALWLKNFDSQVLDEELFAFTDVGEEDLDLEFFEELEMFEEMDELDEESSG